MDNSGSGVCMLEWVVSNPSAPGRDAMRGINAVTEFLTIAARDMGYTFMLTTCRQESLAKVHQRNGFFKTDEGMIHLAKILKEDQ